MDYTKVDKNSSLALRREKATFCQKYVKDKSYYSAKQEDLNFLCGNEDFRNTLESLEICPVTDRMLHYLIELYPYGVDFMKELMSFKQYKFGNIFGIYAEMVHIAKDESLPIEERRLKVLSISTAGGSVLSTVNKMAMGYDVRDVMYSTGYSDMVDVSATINSISKSRKASIYCETPMLDSIIHFQETIDSLLEKYEPMLKEIKDSYICTKNPALMSSEERTARWVLKYIEDFLESDFLTIKDYLEQKPNVSYDKFINSIPTLKKFYPEVHDEYLRKSVPERRKRYYRLVEFMKKLEADIVGSQFKITPYELAIKYNITDFKDIHNKVCKINEPNTKRNLYKWLDKYKTCMDTEKPEKYFKEKYTILGHHITEEEMETLIKDIQEKGLPLNDSIFLYACRKYVLENGLDEDTLNIKAFTESLFGNN